MAVSPYDSLSGALYASRARMNDVIETLYPESGSMLDNTDFFTQQMCINAYRKLQDFLVSLGYPRLRDRTILTNLTAYGSNDPSAQPYISWTAFSSDGSTTVSSPVLPQTLIEPAVVQERVSGQTIPGQFFEMDLIRGPIPSVTKAYNNRFWQWRDDILYLGGATQNFDLMIEFLSYLPDFADNSPTASTPWFNQPVQIMRSQDALSSYICAEFMMALKNAAGAAAYAAAAEDQARQIGERNTKQIDSVQKDSEHAKMRDRYTPVSQ